MCWYGHEKIVDSVLGEKEADQNISHFTLPWCFQQSIVNDPTFSPSLAFVFSNVFSSFCHSRCNPPPPSQIIHRQLSPPSPPVWSAIEDDVFSLIGSVFDLKNHWLISNFFFIDGIGEFNGLMEILGDLIIDCKSDQDQFEIWFDWIWKSNLCFGVYLKMFSMLCRWFNRINQSDDL